MIKPGEYGLVLARKAGALALKLPDAAAGDADLPKFCKAATFGFRCAIFLPGDSVTSGTISVKLLIGDSKLGALTFKLELVDISEVERPKVGALAFTTDVRFVEKSNLLGPARAG